MDITLKNLINFLPIDNKVRQEILAKMDSFTPDQRLAMSRVCWGMFYELVKSQINYEFEKTLNEAQTGKAKLKNQLYKEIEERVYEEYVDKLRKGVEVTALEDVRSKIQETVKTQLETKPVATKPSTEN